MKRIIPLLWLTLSACAPFSEALNRESPRLYVLTSDHSNKPALPAEGPVLLVSPPKAWPGYDTARIAYVKENPRLDYYAKNEWADHPARMIEPLLVKALEASGRFNAVVSVGVGIPAQLRLDTEIIHLRQTFLTNPSQGQLAIRAQLIDLAQQRVLGTQTFNATVPAATDDPSGGVTALHQALDQVLDAIVAFSTRLTSENIHASR